MTYYVFLEVAKEAACAFHAGASSLETKFEFLKGKDICSVKKNILSAFTEGCGFHSIIFHAAKTIC